MLRCPSITATPSCAGCRRSTRTWAPGLTSSLELRQPSGDITGNLQPAYKTILKELKLCRLLKYIGRETAPSPATGNKATHKRELNEFMEKAMTV